MMCNGTYSKTVLRDYTDLKNQGSNIGNTYHNRLLVHQVCVFSIPTT